MARTRLTGPVARLARQWICADEHQSDEADIALTGGLIAQGILSPTDEILEISAHYRDGRVIGVDLVINDAERGPWTLRVGLSGTVSVPTDV